MVLAACCDLQAWASAFSSLQTSMAVSGNRSGMDGYLSTLQPSAVGGNVAAASLSAEARIAMPELSGAGKAASTHLTVHSYVQAALNVLCRQMGLNNLPE